jgi:hypothetical protein
VAQSLASAAEHNPLSNSAARAELIRKAVEELTEKEREVQALNAEIRKYKQKHIKGDLGFKIADWNAIYRVSQLEIEDRDTLLETIREGFAALNIGGVMDWVAAAETAQRRRASTNGYAEPDEDARAIGRRDGLSGVTAEGSRYRQGDPGYGDYMLGLAYGEAERDRVMALGESGNGHANGAAGEAAASKRGRGRPRKRQQETEADAEF